MKELKVEFNFHGNCEWNISLFSTHISSNFLLQVIGLPG